jgi:ribosomal-protein-alanine N-acetyltransferase
MTVADLDTVLALEQRAHAHPWSRGNFSDSLQSGYACRLYTQAAAPATEFVLNAGQALIGYWVAMPGVDESHLLNITVAPALRRQGHARRMMHDLLAWSKAQGAPRLWLEVRDSNQAARALYAALGFEAVGVRKGYYPLRTHAREDAIVMRLDLNP